MSTRPNTKGQLSRLRLPFGRLRDLPIWSKLGLIMIVPIIATIVVGTNGLITNIGDASNADRARTLSTLSAEAGKLVHELQNERANAALLLGAANTPAATEARAVFDRQVQVTEDAARSYRQRSSAVPEVPDSFRAQLTSIDAQLTDLSAMRQQITSGAEMLLSTAVSRYRTVIDDLLAIRDASAELSSNASQGADLRAAAAIAGMKEQVALERVVVLRALAQQSFTPELRKEFNATITGQQQAEAVFRVLAEQSQRELFDRTVTGADLREAAKFEGLVSPLTTDALPEGIFTSAQWDSAMIGKSNLLRRVEAELDDQNIADASAERNLLQRQVLIGTGLLLGMLLLAILFAWMVARSMARSLRELRHGALTVAQFGLPQAVARLRDPALTAQMSPQQIAVQIAEPLPIRSRDEFGQVAEAFNAVHLEAVRTAAEQAALRSSVATMFVNLARRSQILVDRLIGHLDRLERGEEDPDRLAELFQLDHLATRMRRNDENLLVLAGADSTRVQREPAPLMDVLRAAQSEVEHYTRIEFGQIDRDIEIAAHAVNDMVHLVAELLDNATAFSPPDSAVVVDARRLGDRAALLVEDRGIGISPEQIAELNERLANPPMVDVAVSRMMGLVVVARLANRHGVKVELRQARERGTIADMTLPTSVLVPRALAGRVATGMPVAGMPAGPREVPGRPTTPVPRSPLATPLALESGPGARGGPLSNGNEMIGAGSNGYTNGASPTRGLPAWSDLTGVNGLNGVNGVNGTNGHDTRSPKAPANGFMDPLPQRRATEGPGEGEPAVDEYGGIIPRQRPEMPQGHAVEAPPYGGGVAPGYPEPPLPGHIVSPEPVDHVDHTGYASQPGYPDQTGHVPAQIGPAGPPAWPPSNNPAVHHSSVPPEPEPAAPHQPGIPSSADMTAEIPKVRLGWEPEPEAREVEEPRQRFVDETMELPIFRELESAWFRTRRPGFSGPPTGPFGTNGTSGNGAREPVNGGATEHVNGDVGAPASLVTATDETTRLPTSPVASGTPAVEVVNGSTDRASTNPSAAWQTAADEGWQAAAALAEQREFAVTETGLPKRVPMSQLVPGGVEKSTTTVHRRTPESVRGLLSAYHRGVQRGRTSGGRTDDGKTPEPTSAGPHNSQGGKEQEA